MVKKGYFSTGTTGRRSAAWDLCGCNMACKATWQSHADPCERLRGMDVARTHGRATRAHANARMAPRGMRSDMVAIDGPTSIVDLG